MEFNDLDIKTEIDIDWGMGAVFITVDKVKVKLPFETFIKIIDYFKDLRGMSIVFGDVVPDDDYDKAINFGIKYGLI